MAPARGTHFQPSVWTRPKPQLRGCLGQSVAISRSVQIVVLLPLSTVLNTLSFSSIIMALSKVGNHRVIHSQGREIAYNVWKFMSNEAVNGIAIPLKSVCERVLAATGISKRTLAKIRKEGRNIEGGASTSFSTPGKSRPKTKIVAAVDGFDEEVIRKLIYNFHSTHKKRPTLKSLYPEVIKNTSFRGGKTSLRKLLLNLGFR